MKQKSSKWKECSQWVFESFNPNTGSSLKSACGTQKGLKEESKQRKMDCIIPDMLAFLSSGAGECYKDSFSVWFCFQEYSLFPHFLRLDLTTGPD